MAGNVDYNLPREEARKNSISAVKEYCKWAKKEDVYVALELEPEGLFILNSVQAIKEFLNEVNEENCCANADIGHLHVLREKPENLAVIKDKIVHIHISENNGFAHTNDVIGEGNVDFKWFVETIYNLGMDKNCERFGDVAVAGLEIGEPREFITDSDYRVLKSIGNALSRIPLLRGKTK